MGPTSASIFLRVLVTPNSEVRYKTTINVPSDMYLADVLELICRKRQLAHADEWALVVPDKDIVVPLDRTVESLQGNHDLALVRRSTLGAQGGAGALTGQSTNPNGKRLLAFERNFGVRAGQLTSLNFLPLQPRSSNAFLSQFSQNTTPRWTLRLRTRCVWMVVI